MNASLHMKLQCLAYSLSKARGKVKPFPDPGQ